MVGRVKADRSLGLSSPCSVVPRVPILFSSLECLASEYMLGDLDLSCS
jgi:hypothetical protein